MVFTEKEIFTGIGIFIIIGGLVAFLIIVNTSDENFYDEIKLPSVEGILEKFNGITGNVVNNFESISVEKDYCGDNFCYKDTNGDWESCNSCPVDCGECNVVGKCGNSICSLGECSSCPSDCSFLECQNGICEEDKGETCSNSPNDCSCSEDSRCIKDICVSLSCGNGKCETLKAEDCNSCKQDCGLCDCRTLGGNSCKVGQECNGEVKNGCCLSSCEWSWKYPLIFVHGHSKSEDGSKYSISTFNEFQNRLVLNNLYGKREPILANDEKINFKEGQWANTELPISIRTTYYYGEYSLSGGFIYQDNNQEIEEYARRLEKIIDIVKYATGRDKVDIVAHSMGGLVSREYVRQTKGKDINKLVMIGTPNDGIYGYSGSLCGSLFAGRKQTPECEDMQHNSPFLNKLNNGDVIYRSKYLTISGKAKEVDWNDQLKRGLCPDGKSYHDEVICSTSVYLDESKNEYVLGNQVSGISETFHNYLVSPSEVLEVYNKVIGFLKE
jgi:hypothetical protein